MIQIRLECTGILVNAFMIMIVIMARCSFLAFKTAIQLYCLLVMPTIDVLLERMHEYSIVLSLFPDSRSRDETR